MGKDIMTTLFVERVVEDCQGQPCEEASEHDIENPKDYVSGRLVDQRLGNNEENKTVSVTSVSLNGYNSGTEDCTVPTSALVEDSRNTNGTDTSNFQKEEKQQCNPEKCKRKYTDESEKAKSTLAGTETVSEEHLCKKICPLAAKEACKHGDKSASFSVADTGENKVLSKGTKPDCFVGRDNKHSSRDCPTSLNTAKVCYVCGQEGHLARSCPYANSTFTMSPPPAMYFTNQDQVWQNNTGPAFMTVPIASFPAVPMNVPLYPLVSSPYRPRGSRTQRPMFYSNVYPQVGYPQDCIRVSDYSAAIGDLSHSKHSSTTINSKFNNGRCFRCGKYGHWTRDCPEKPSDADPNGCYKCGQRGHIARDCTACYICQSLDHKAVHCPKNPKSHPH